MAGPIYKLFMVKFTDARYQLSEEEQNSQNAKVQEALEKVGGKSILTCTSAWSSEQWLGFGVEEFPDVDAVQKQGSFIIAQADNTINPLRPLLDVTLREQASRWWSFAFPEGGSDEQTST